MDRRLDLGLSVEARGLGRLRQARWRRGADDQERRPPGPRQFGGYQGGDPARTARDHDGIPRPQLDGRIRASQHALDRPQADAMAPVIAHFRPAVPHEHLRRPAGRPATRLRLPRRGRPRGNGPGATPGPEVLTSPAIPPWPGKNSEFGLPEPANRPPRRRGCDQARSARRARRAPDRRPSPWPARTNP